MCTVSYIPQDENRFVFTSNRDENPLRAATELHKLEINKKTLYFPQDSQVLDVLLLKTGATGSLF